MATTVKSSKNGGAPNAEIQPEEAAKIRAAAAGKEQAPSSREQALFANWRQVADQLGDPFEVERIPISKLKAMRRDPMLGFGLSFIKTPHLRAKWFIDARDKNGPNAQVAAHLDYDLRRIYPSFVLQYCNGLDFGFQALVKRFELRTPSGTFIATDPNSGDQTEQPIWSQGSVQPIGWKPFVALPPEKVEPIWAGDGSFNGIDFDPTANVSGAASSQQNATKRKIDIYHSLWITNERDQNFGSIYGYPRLGYAYRYWWSYWFRWAIADRAFERKADPSVIVYHPEGEFVDENTGDRLSYAEYALTMGERMRSGGVIALPSEVYEDATGRGTIRQWELDFTKDATNFEPFDKSFDYLDIQKLRSLCIPEQAFLEGKGGTSSRNVAHELGESFTESQAVLASQIVETINRWLIPQWLAVNYPEFLAANGTAIFQMQGFADQDIDFQKQIIQLIGQQLPGVNEMMKIVDLRKVLEDAGTPILPFADQKRREQEIAQQAAAAAPPAVTPVPGQQVGVVPNAGAPTGFSYIQPREVIYLADTATDFIDSLPDSPHYTDKTIKNFARQLWGAYKDLYRDEYESAFQALLDEDVEAADDDIELADFGKRARRMLSRWKGSPKWEATLARTKEIFRKIARQASKIELKRADLSGAEISQDDIDQWIEDHLATFAAQVTETTNKEIQDFVTARLEEGMTDRGQIVELGRKHFEGFPKWKTDRLVRTEVRDVYNFAALLAGKSAGIKQVQALDASDGTDHETDEECQRRHGKIFTIGDASRVKEHPNGTLHWRLLKSDVQMQGADEPQNGNHAWYDDDAKTVFFTSEVSDEQRTNYLIALVDRLEGGRGAEV